MRNMLRSLVVPVLLLSLAWSETNAQQHTTRRHVQQETFEWDLSKFGMRFERCQYVKMFDDEMAEEQNAGTVLATKHFVVYKLCPIDECDTCDEVHGEYVVDVEDYLQTTVEYQQEAFEYLCENCNERCNNGDYCDGCGEQCYEYDNLEANGYVDASEYIECQRVDANDDDDGDDELFVGPRCSQYGNEIEIGLFSDEDCTEPYYDREVEDVLGVKLSYHILERVQSSEDGLCLSCKENDENQNENDAADYDDVNEMCEEVYRASGKCESKYGLDSGFVQMNREDGDYENQVENEFMVCNFIDSLVWNSYTETGEINIEGPQDVVYRYTTPLQKFVLSIITITAFGLAAYTYYLHEEIKKASPRVDLSAQTDNQLI